MREVPRPSWAVLGCALLCAASPGARALAQTPCAELPNPVYLQVGDTQEPLMKALGRALRDEAEPLTLVYVTSGSCTNIEAVYGDVPISKNPLYVPSSAEDPAWTSKDPALTCVLEAGGHAIDIANSALFVSSCDPDPAPGDVQLFQGPVQGYGFIVPRQSSQRAITAEEAYFAFGFGDEGMAEPWTDEAFIFIRTVTKSTLLTLAAAVGVPAASFHGQRLDKSSEVLSSVVATNDAEKTIGLLGVELFDQSREKVKLLAFQAFGQRYAYFPDSSATTFDKRNLRDGHYVPWSPTVWLTKRDARGEIDAAKQQVIDLILGNATTPAPSFEPLEIVIGVGLVPDCAMRVTREYEAGPLSRYEPEQPCGCYYDAQVRADGSAPEGCATCDEDRPCASGVCRHGYCEAR